LLKKGVAIDEANPLVHLLAMDQKQVIIFIEIKILFYASTKGIIDKMPRYD
jgi:hypothetical protein